ncbi:hypothetical protein DTO166G4_7038 [Paecilomyces variotii]|nr:hypothetical protein DTO164E3_2325 [Paecilomyces variotii]KAJ9205581.1 hypothetical protein DTO032I3_2137 [Paecilomyces variotii]KAJ9211416.1 hypothetical protein DTO166G4_7038 [Paecilomyces variotii]KAJ9225877.1 hypothetical protein DTO169C6_1940 [Paecilomyces variotii]KAJ9233922.1 hypothetical protein DTO166G5_5414 [Paecilomyces variotii]
MPGRLLPNFVRPVASSLHNSATASTHSNNSSSSSVNEISHQTVSRKQPANAHAVQALIPERRLSFSMESLESLIHPHKESKEKRRSLGRSSRSKERPAARDESHQPPAQLDVIFESPPLVFYGSPANSSGALMSGRLLIDVAEIPGAVTLQKLEMRLTSSISTKKPVSRDCPNCSTRTEPLCEWDFLTEPAKLQRGKHDYPFSYLFPGHLPASANGTLGGVEYKLSARALTSTGEEFTFQTPLTIRRAILPGNDKSSIRIFPPTNLTGRVVLPSVVHPIGTFPVQMTLSGVVDKGEETQTRWRLRKMMWRIEEHQKIISTACAKHAHKVGGEGKGVLHQETRIIGHNEEKSGWKTDFDTAGGEITMEFDANIKPGCNPVCDMDAPGGLEVKHNLVIELIVAEEFCPNRNTKLITPTGAARVLRMQFHLHVTERSGLGISWDEEMPPVYNDVPASPPGYAMLDVNSTMEDYRGSPLPLPDYQDLERMEHLRLDGDSTRSSRPSMESMESRPQERARLTTDDLVAGPPIETRGRAHPEDEGDSSDVAQGVVR